MTPLDTIAKPLRLIAKALGLIAKPLGLIAKPLPMIARPLGLIALAAALAAVLWGQQFKFNLEHLAGKASDAVDVSLNSNMLQFAAKFMDTKDPDEAQVKKLITGLEGIYIRSFEFKKEGAYSASDLDQVRNQLKAPEWSRIFSIKNSGESQTEVWVRNAGGKVAGIAILSSEPKQLTVANLVGYVDIDSLATLGGHFGLPKMDDTKKKK